MNTKKQDTVYLETENVVRPLHRLPEGIIITEEFLLFRKRLANNIARLSDTTVDYGWAWCQADCCLWDYEGFLQNN